MLSILLVMLIIALVIILTANHVVAYPSTYPNLSNGLELKAKATSTPSPLSTDRMLWAIAQAENTPNHVVGAAGERSCFQIHEHVWVQWSNHPFIIASSNHLPDTQEVRRVANAHLYHIRRTLHELEAQDSPYLIALCWTAGISAVLNDTASPRKRAYAQRVDNLYHSSTP